MSLSPRGKQRIGNALSLVGIAPLFAWLAVLTLLSLRVGIPKEATFGFSDVMLLLATGAVAYLFGLLLAVPACLYTRRLLRLHPDLPRAFTQGSQIAVAVLMLLPVVVMGVEYLRFLPTSPGAAP